MREVLGLDHAPGSVLLSDGYAAYESFAKKAELVHAQCWAHARREIFEAQAADPQGAHEALEQIQQLYDIEEDIRKHNLRGDNKRLHRLTHSKPRVEAFFEWLHGKFEHHGLRPSNAFTKALEYVRKRRAGLEVFLSDPDVAMDTNHLERALRANATDRGAARAKRDRPRRMAGCNCRMRLANSSSITCAASAEKERGADPDADARTSHERLHV